MPPRATKAAEAAAIKPHTLVVDNGAFTIKAGFVSTNPALGDCHIIPNCIARDHRKRLYVGSELEKCKDFYHIALRRPVEKGMVVNWELERTIWHQSFLSEKNAVLKCDPHETNLILTEAPNVFQALQTNCDQMVFEEFEFASYCRTTGPTLNVYNDVHSLFGDEPQKGAGALPSVADCLLIIDSGFSHTTVTPLLNGHPLQDAVRRLDVGGKHLTNYLAELLAIHELSLKEDPWIANEVKEATCFVTESFREDMEKTWRSHQMDSTIVVDVQLPDYQDYFNVIVRPYDGAKDPLYKAKSSIITLGNEQFQVPELLFTPGDIGMLEGGLPELVMQSVGVLPEGLRPGMLANIMVVGGNVKLRGFMSRLENEIRKLAPVEYVVRVASPPDPIKSTWLGGARMATSKQELKKHVVTREQYLEHGSVWLQRHFAGQES